MNIELLKKQSERYDAERVISPEERCRRLKVLVEKHGIDKVSAASGLGYASIATYTSKPNYAVSTATLLKAEHILGKLADE